MKESGVSYFIIVWGIYQRKHGVGVRLINREGLYSAVGRESLQSQFLVERSGGVIYRQYGLGRVPPDQAGAAGAGRGGSDHEG